MNVGRPEGGRHRAWGIHLADPYIAKWAALLSKENGDSQNHRSHRRGRHSNHPVSRGPTLPPLAALPKQFHLVDSLSSISVHSIPEAHHPHPGSSSCFLVVAIPI